MLRAIAVVLAGWLAAACSDAPLPRGDAGATQDSGVTADAGITVIGDQCCCEHIAPGTGDIVVEDLKPTANCPNFEQGKCILVDPGRFTPHPCCPDATGPRCGS